MQDPETGATRQYIVTQMCDSTSKSLTEWINILDFNLSKNLSVSLSRTVHQWAQRTADHPDVVCTNLSTELSTDSSQSVHQWAHRTAVHPDVVYQSGKQNLETIVEAIRHLEGDHLFSEESGPHQVIQLRRDTFENNLVWTFEPMEFHYFRNFVTF